jgi:crotonobetainyl-CoA:carnitine CoA-transferase CaiB-like acyl-CoA transferase
MRQWVQILLMSRAVSPENLKISSMAASVKISLSDGSQPYTGKWFARKGRSAHKSVPSFAWLWPDSVRVMCNKEKFSPLLCELLEAPYLAKDERFKDFQSRFDNKD